MKTRSGTIYWPGSSSVGLAHLHLLFFQHLGITTVQFRKGGTDQLSQFTCSEDDFTLMVLLFGDSVKVDKIDPKYFILIDRPPGWDQFINEYMAS